MLRPGWLARRRREPELVDDPGQPTRALAANLAELAWTNRVFGGVTSVTRFLRPVTRLEGQRLILDVGTGTGESFRDLGAWSRRMGMKWSFVALDRSSRVLGLDPGGENPLMRCAGDALALPFPDDTFDAVISLQTLHHFDDGDAIRVVREMDRVCRGRVVVSDLRRSRATYLAVKALASSLWRSPLTRHDGPASVRSAFTATELAELGERGGADGCAVHRHGPFRLVLTWEKA